MSDVQEPVTTGDGSTGAVFVWHPEYAGKSVDQVRRDLAGEIGRDQRAYHLAIEGAEASEADSLHAIVDLERRWGMYKFDWAETDASALADRIVNFEQVRESRQELIDFADYRASGALMESHDVAETSSDGSLPVMKIGAVILVVLIVLFVLSVVL